MKSTTERLLALILARLVRKDGQNFTAVRNELKRAGFTDEDLKELNIPEEKK